MKKAAFLLLLLLQVPLQLTELLINQEMFFRHESNSAKESANVSLMYGSHGQHPISGGVIENKSSANIWITAAHQRWCLEPGKSTKSLPIPEDDADGLLLDGHRVFLDNDKVVLGGKKFHSEGAIKLCNFGIMSVEDEPNEARALKVTISRAGLICAPDSAGYHEVRWCRAHAGWDIKTASLAHDCARK